MLRRLGGRHRIVEQLGHHLADGRLSLQEFDDRVTLVLESQTMGELVALVDDLPCFDHEAEPSPWSRLHEVALWLHVQAWVLLSVFWLAFWQLSGLRQSSSPALPVAIIGLSVALHWTVRRALAPAPRAPQPTAANRAVALHGGARADDGGTPGGLALTAQCSGPCHQEQGDSAEGNDPNGSARRRRTRWPAAAAGGALDRLVAALAARRLRA